MQLCQNVDRRLPEVRISQRKTLDGFDRIPEPVAIELSDIVTDMHIHSPRDQRISFGKQCGEFLPGRPAFVRHGDLLGGVTADLVLGRFDHLPEFVGAEELLSP